MKCSMIVFSPTGGTKKAAEMLCSYLGTETECFDLCDATLNPMRFQAEKDAIAVIAMPSYGGRIPTLAAERLHKMHGNGMPCVLLCVYGNRAYDDTLAEMEDIAKDCHFHVIAAVAAVAEHSIIRTYAAGRPDQRDEQKLAEIAGRIKEKLENGMEHPFVIPGNRPYKKAGAGQLIPKADKGCVNCGICAKQCPAQAIDRKNVKTADKNKCISCMRCVEVCPQSARKVNKAMVSVAAMAIKKACSIRKECEAYL